MLSNILRNTSAIFNPAALFELASKGIPNFAETMFDAKTVRTLSLSALEAGADQRRARTGSRHSVEEGL